MPRHNKIRKTDSRCIIYIACLASTCILLVPEYFHRDLRYFKYSEFLKMGKLDIWIISRRLCGVICTTKYVLCCFTINDIAFSCKSDLVFYKMVICLNLYMRAYFPIYSEHLHFLTHLFRNFAWFSSWLYLFWVYILTSYYSQYTRTNFPCYAYTMK